VRRAACSWPSLALVLGLLAGPALAQEFSVDLGGDGGSLSLRSVQLLLLITVLSIVPGLAVMVTCFPFIVIVLSILRQAIGLQQAPPNMLIVTLSLFLTWYVMDPVFTQAWVTGNRADDERRDGGRTRAAGGYSAVPGVHVAKGRQRHLPDTGRPAPCNGGGHPSLGPLSLLVPSFLLSEIQRAFEIGFMIFLPFLIIDLVVAAILMSMGMMMVPPAVVSLPFKLAFFVVADGWALITGALVRSYF
jgi:flagellar biosynthesis protein FliP